MAIRYLWSGATGAANGTSWANAFTTSQLLFNSDGAGDTLFVAHDHVEAAASVSFPAAGTNASPTKFICADRLGSVPPVSADRRTTAQITSTGNNPISISGCIHLDGIILICGNSTGAANLEPQTTSQLWTRFDNCKIRFGSTGSGVVRIGIAGAINATWIEFNNTTVEFSGTGQTIQVYGTLKWRNTPAALLGTMPTTLLTPAQSGGEIECIGVDLSALGAGQTIFGVVTSATAAKYRLLDCKLDPAVTKAAAPNGVGTYQLDILRSGATAANYTIYARRYTGELTEETTIVRSGGASDGTTPISWKVVTTANCSYSMPFECPPIAIWNDTIGSAVTATVEGIWGGAVPLDDEVWLDVEYLGDASSPQASFVNDGKANILSTAVNQTTSTATWGGVPSFGDAYFGSTKLLMGFTGADASTGAPGMTDESSALRGNASVFGAAQIDTAQFKFGASSLLLDGNDDYVAFADHADWDFGTGPFTIEGFFRFAGAPTNAALVAQWGAGWAFYFESGALKLRSGSVVDTNPYTWAPTLNQWYHIAVDRDASSVARIYVDGIMRTKTTGYTPNLSGSTIVLCIGSLRPSGINTFDLNGHVDEIRITKGEARYGSDSGYTVPTAAFPRTVAMIPFKLGVTFTPQQKGWIYARVKCAKPSSTFYIDPLVTLT